MLFLQLSSIAIGASLGATLRWFFALLLNPSYWPLGTLSVNVLGSFVIGGLFAYWEVKGWPNQLINLFLVTGFLGGFTTFSSFSFEVLQLFINKRFFYAFAYISASFVISIGSVVLSYYLIQKILFTE